MVLTVIVIFSVTFALLKRVIQHLNLIESSILDYLV